MNQKFDCILLIDDDLPTNFYHKIMIKDADCTHKAVFVTGGKEALTYLTNQSTNTTYIKPDLIFLDINMPGMNGWEFLEYYKKLTKDQQAEHGVILLTTSLNPNDKDKAISNDAVVEFSNKPLSVELLQEIANRYISA